MGLAGEGVGRGEQSEREGLQSGLRGWCRTGKGEPCRLRRGRLYPAAGSRQPASREQDIGLTRCVSYKDPSG